MTVSSILYSERFRRLSVESFWIVLGQGLSLIGSLVLVRILTQHLDSWQFGELALSLAISALANQLIMGPLSGGVSRFYSIAYEHNDILSYLRASFWLTTYATIILIIITSLIFFGLKTLDYQLWAKISVFAMVFAALSGYNTILNGVQNAARQRIIVAFHGVLLAVFRIILVLIAIRWVGCSSIIVLVSYSLALLIVNISQFVLVRRLVINRSDKPGARPWERDICKFSWPYAAWGGLAWAQQTSDRWALNAFVSTNEVGFYAVILQLGYAPLNLATNLLTSFLSPILYQRAGSANDRSRNRSVHNVTWQITFFCLCLTSVAFGAIVCLHRYIFYLFVAEQYYSVSYLLPWGILAGGIFASGQVLSIKLTADLRSESMIAAKVVTAILGIALNFLGAFLWGIQGVVAMMVVFSVIHFIWMAFLARRPL